MLVNTCGAVGYLLLALTWVFFASAIVWLGMQSSLLTSPVDLNPSQTPVISQASPSFAAQLTAYTVTVAMVLTTIGLLLTLPYLVGKWGAHIVRQLMRIVRVPLTRRNLFLTKGMLAVTPLAGFILINLVSEPLDMTLPILHITAIVVGVVSIGCFWLQLATARALSLPMKDVW